VTTAACENGNLSEGTARLSSIAKRSLPWLIGAVLAATALLPHDLNPGVVTAAGLLVGGTLALVGAIANRKQIERSTLTSVVLVSALAAWLTIRAFSATNPEISLAGIVGLNQGASLYVLGLVWLLAGLLCSDGRTLRSILGVSAGAGVAFTLAATWEHVFMGANRTQGAAAGFFENSTTLGGFLAVAAFCALILAVSSDTRSGRGAACLAGVASLVGTFAASSRVGMLGLGAGLCFALAAHSIRSPRGRALLAGVAAPSVVLAVSGLMIAASLGILGTQVQSTIDKLGTERDVIWRSAAMQFTEAPIVGSGPQQFSAFIEWRVTADGGFAGYITNDPHSMLLSVALGGGAMGVALMLGAGSTLLWSLLRGAAQTKHRLGASLLASLPVVAIGSALVDRTSPASILIVMAVSGAALRPRISKETRGTISRAHIRPLAMAGAVVGLGLALLTGYAAGFDRQFLAMSTTVDARLTFAEAIELYEQWPEPGFLGLAEQAIAPAALAGDPEAITMARRLLVLSTRDAAWSCDLAADRTLLRASDVKGSSMQSVVTAAETGIEADGTSGLWYALEATAASRRALPVEASKYALLALGRPLDPETRALMLEIAER
jgi:hypothetical protein